MLLNELKFPKFILYSRSDLSEYVLRNFLDSIVNALSTVREEVSGEGRVRSVETLLRLSDEEWRAYEERRRRGRGRRRG